MSVLIRFAPASLTAEQYEAVVRELEEGGVFPSEGLDLHVCFGTDGNLRVSEVWDSREQFDAIAPKLMSTLAELGIDAGEPEFMPVHKVIKR